MDELTQHGTTETEIESMSRSRQSLDYVRQELLEYRPDIVDAELRSQVTEFLMESADLPPATAREHIAQELHDIRSEHAMRRETGMTDPEQAFPDRCRGCPHYGVRCPVLTETRAIDRRKRIFRETDSPIELRRRLREYAIDYDCGVIKDAIDDLVEDHQPLLVEGHTLLMLVEETLFFGDSSEETERKLAGKIEQMRAQRRGEAANTAEETAAAEAGAEPPHTAGNGSPVAGITAATQPVETDGSGDPEVTDDGD